MRIEEPSRNNLIAAGIFTVVHRISSERVRKLARSTDKDNTQAIQREAYIYSLLGDNALIAKCIECTDSHVDLQYYQNGTLHEYISNHPPSSKQRVKWGAQIIEGVQYIHRFGVIHSDLALRQFLLDDDYNARLSDFSASGILGSDGLGCEAASHYLPREQNEPNSVASDLFAVGSTLYELATGEAPYATRTEEEIAELYSHKIFPNTSTLFCGEVIASCWRREFLCCTDLLESYNAESLRKRSTGFHDEEALRKSSADDTSTARTHNKRDAIRHQMLRHLIAARKWLIWLSCSREDSDSLNSH